jgi:hypothetical protein
MASNALVYFAGVGTVVTALGIGFGGAMVLTSTTPTYKEPPAAFAKREHPITIDKAEPADKPVQANAAPAAPVVTAVSPAEKPTGPSIIDSLAYAPPQAPEAQRAPIQPPMPQTAPATAPHVAAPASFPPPVVASGASAQSATPPARREAAKPKPMKKRIDPARNGSPTQFADRAQRHHIDQEEPRLSFASEPARRSGRGEGFFSFMFGD